MTWNTYHRRGETLRDVIALVDERRDGELPRQLPGVAENFDDDLDLLGALLLKWHARLSGNIERALAQQPMDLASAVVTAWRTTAEQMPGVRLVVDRAATTGTPEVQEAMERARQRECERLALAAGVANGRALEARARAELPDLARREVRPPAHDEANASLVDRIKAVLAAA